MREQDTQNSIRIEAARHGLTLWRNNSGALRDVTGRVVRYGLGNDSPAVNRVCKSSDLIGLWRGRFVAIECKPPGWRYHGNDRERAQLAFLELVHRAGGLGCFATCWDDVLKELDNANT